MSKEDDIRLDQKVRAAWMYYIAGQNQSEIASQLGTSRPVVQRLIAAAKEEGIVSINLHHPVANCLDYAQLLQEKYRLIECNVVPAFSEESTLDSVSFGCYQLMARYLQDDKVVHQPLIPQRLRRRPRGGRDFCRHWSAGHAKSDL